MPPIASAYPTASEHEAPAGGLELAVSARRPVTRPAIEPSTWTRADFQHFVQPHLPRLYRLCLTLCRNPSEADDLLQNALVKAYLHRASYEGRGSLISWLYGIVRHEHIEIVRTQRRRKSLLDVALDRWSDVLESWFGGPGKVEASPEDAAIMQQEAQSLLACLRSVREPFRTAVFLCDVEDMGYEEAAQVMGVAIGTVKSRHARGRAMLREAFEKLQRRQGGAT
jgi:RNA polymerase sigma-70 factor, ECF subfamily